MNKTRYRKVEQADEQFRGIEDERVKNNVPTEEKVFKTKKELTSHKAPDIDGIPSEHLKYEINIKKTHT